MELTSLGFLLYFLPIMLAGYYLLGFFRRIRNLWLVLCGLGFYFLSGTECVLWVIGLAVFNYIMGYVVHLCGAATSTENRHRFQKQGRYLMTISILVNLAPFFWFVHFPSAMGTLAS